MTCEMIREYVMCQLISCGRTSKERCDDKTRRKEGSREIHAEITPDIIVIEESRRNRTTETTL